MNQWLGRSPLRVAAWNFSMTLRTLVRRYQARENDKDGVLQIR